MAEKTKATEVPKETCTNCEKPTTHAYICEDCGFPFCKECFYRDLCVDCGEGKE